MASLQELIDRGMAFFGSAETKLAEKDKEISQLKEAAATFDAQKAKATEFLKQLDADLATAKQTISTLSEQIKAKDAQIAELTELAKPGRQAAQILSQAGVPAVNASPAAAPAGGEKDFATLVSEQVKAGKSNAEAVMAVISENPTAYSAWLKNGGGNL